jgi:hypothetical protein
VSPNIGIRSRFWATKQGKKKRRKEGRKKERKEREKERKWERERKKGNERKKRRKEDGEREEGDRKGGVEGGEERGGEGKWREEGRKGRHFLLQYSLPLHQNTSEAVPPASLTAQCSKCQLLGEGDQMGLVNPLLLLIRLFLCRMWPAFNQICFLFKCS